MEQVHGVDVSWMNQCTPKDRINSKTAASTKTAPAKTLSPAVPRQIPSPTTPTTDKNASGQINGHKDASPPVNGSPGARRASRSGSVDRPPSINGTSPQRRNSWFSNISAKFSSSPPQNGAAPLHNHTNQPLPTPQEDVSTSPIDSSFEPQSPKSVPARNAVLQHGARPEGDGPYTPAPPKSAQAGFLGVFRRLSTSSQSNHIQGGKMTHGLVERKVFNVDKNRERCPISELKHAKLRRVSFCVDVEIAPMPKYFDGEAEPQPIERTTSKRLSEKGEGEALKKRNSIPEDQEDAAAAAVEKKAPEARKEPEKKSPANEVTKESTEVGATSANGSPPSEDNKDTTKKKEKKKKSEEERKARKEKKRKLAEANGSIPMEIRYDSSDSSTGGDCGGTGTPKTTTVPTTNPVRIYRRCCQLRETPILKKITEQLLDTVNSSPETGIVNKLNLTGYWLQLPDLVTLGDYLAVVPVREIILENIGLTDEGLRLILAGLLAAKRPDTKRRKPKHELEEQGGVVERVVLKNNKLGPDGWKHLSLFVYLSRSLKYLDLSNVPFPRQSSAAQNGGHVNGLQVPRTISELFSKALSERLGGSALELINLAETEPSMGQLGTIMDGVIKCGVKRLGIAHNHLDDEGVQHIGRYLAAGKCEGLDLGGNDLRDQLEKLTASIKDDDPLWALSLSDCNLEPSSLSKIMPKLIALRDFRFIDLSNNQDLFQSSPSAVGLLRRYLPKMSQLKRIHLQAVGLTPEQTIALVEVLPEVRQLAHVNFKGNTELAKLANPKTEEAQEEACALYASLMSAARVSDSLIAVDIEVPSEEASEIVKGMAKQVVAYTLRNMERLQDVVPAVASALAVGHGGLGFKQAAYSDVIAHIVGHDVMDQDDTVDDDASAPDEDYVIGGTGVVKALACCLQNHGDDSRRQSGEFMRDGDGDEGSHLPKKLATAGKAKDMSKHLLAGARKIRRRLQPALQKARSMPEDEQNLRKLMFLDETLEGIIKRFEEEYPDTREPDQDGVAVQQQEPKIGEPLSTSPSRAEEYPPVLSDGEDDGEIHSSRPLSRSNSILSKALNEEEGRVHRAGHQFRSKYLIRSDKDILAAVDDISNDPKHDRILSEIAEEAGGEFLELAKKKGVVRAFKEDIAILTRDIKASDTEYWERFEEAQRMARANITVPSGDREPVAAEKADESAIAD